MTQTTDKVKYLQAVEARWNALQDAQKAVKECRKLFIDSIIEGSKVSSQLRIAERCKTDNGHISRGRIAQFLMEAKNEPGRGLLLE